MSRYVTGVTVVTMRVGDLMHGVTVNSFSSVSMEPPLVQVCLDRRSRASSYLIDGPFCVNVLSTDQVELARHFAGQVKLDHASLGWDPVPEIPRLTGSLAHIYCLPWACYDGGDHLIHLGRIHEVEIRDGDPLVFHDQGFRPLRPMAENDLSCAPGAN
jgi:flavin reductase (DIM6/NTAB) family NADH-FMN oxidoreductase RutF